jgi:DHA1 family bicyclomycin/chloramphenicol resistance-like MFS transporter
MVEKHSPHPPSMLLLFAMIYAGQMASTIYLPGLPEIARDLDATVSAAQTLVAAYLGAFAFSQLVMGPLSDRFGRRPVVLAGLVLFTLSSVLCILVPTIGTLLAVRFAQAAGACATIVVDRAMIRDTAEGVAAAHAMSWFAIAMAVGPATAPFIGGLLTAWFGWQSTFIATALVGTAVLVFVVFDLEETLPPESRRPPRASELVIGYMRLLGNPVFVGYSMVVALASGSIQTYITAIPIVFLVVMGVSPQAMGAYIMIMPMIFVVATYTSRRLTARLPIDRIILIGVAFSATGGLLQVLFGLWGVTTPYPVIVAVAISNFGTGLVFANCYAQALSTVPPSSAGQASALGGFMHMGWGGILSIIVANMAHTSSLQFGTVQMATTWLAAAMALFLIFAVKRRA